MKYVALDCISFVGIDEKTDLQACIDLSDGVDICGLPSLELGFLYSESPSKQSDNRYPSYKFIVDSKKTLEDAGVFTSVHLCGSEAIEAFFNGEKYIMDLIGKSRVQLNFNMAKYDVETVMTKIFSMSLRHNKRIIIQNNKSKAKLVEGMLEFIVSDGRNIDILHDASGGFGKEISKVEPPYRGIMTGYAGGLKPGNIAALLAKIDAVNDDSLPYYIDMESGIRTDEWFDIEKCKDVVSEVLDYIQEAEKDVG